MIANGLDQISIGDAARMLGVATHTIRFWEREFSEFLDPPRNPGRQRRYLEMDIDRLRRIHFLLKVEGYSIAGARRALAKNLYYPETPEMSQECPIPY